MRFTFIIEADGDRYCASCSELDVATSGKDIPEALEQIAEAAALYIRTAEELGYRLDQCGSVPELVAVAGAVVKMSREQRRLR